MNSLVTEMSIAARPCRLFKQGEGGSAFLLGCGAHEGESAEKLFELVREKTGAPFSLMVYESADWDSAYSPWPINGFSGGGAQTLMWLAGACAPQMRALGCQKLYPAGYSLSGLFALWAYFEKDAFDGAVCCSGSLWFEGFEEYIKCHRAREGAAIYLSLGGKEEKSAPDFMKRVGENTRLCNRLLRQDKRIVTTLEMNPGGHFAPAEPRLAKGILWIMEKASHLRQGSAAPEKSES